MPIILKLDQVVITGYENTTNGMFGDIRYRAPEVIRGKVYDFRADLWSYGVILFYLLSGGVYPYDYQDKDLNYKGNDNRPPHPHKRKEEAPKLMKLMSINEV